MDHVDMPEAALVADVDRAKIGTYRHALRLHHQQRRRGALGQARTPAQQQVFQAPLQGGVEGGADQRRAARRVQAPGQQRRQCRLLARGEQQGFLTRLGNALCRPQLVLGQALQHLVAGTLGALRMAVGAQAARCLRQHREQRGLGRRQVFR